MIFRLFLRDLFAWLAHLVAFICPKMRYFQDACNVAHVYACMHVCLIHSCMYIHTTCLCIHIQVNTFLHANALAPINVCNECNDMSQHTSILWPHFLQKTFLSFHLWFSSSLNAHLYIIFHPYILHSSKTINFKTSNISPVSHRLHFFFII